MALETHLAQMLKRDDFIVAYWKIIDQVPHEIRQRHSKLPKLYGQFWLDLIKEGQESGELRADLDANIVRLLLVGSSIYSLMWYHEEGRLSVEEIAGVLIEMFFNGMRRRDGDLAIETKAAAKPATEKAEKPKSAKGKPSGAPLARSIALPDNSEVAAKPVKAKPAGKAKA